MKEELIKKYMEKYACTREEAISVIEEDEEINRTSSTAKLESDLTAEQKQASKEVRSTTSDKREKAKRERKPDETKEAVITTLADFLKENGYADTEILNKSNEIGFKIGAENFSLKLVRHRAPKSA